MKRVILLCAVVALGLAAQPVLGDFYTGFEPNEPGAGGAYVGAPAGVPITGQDNWAPQFGSGFRAVYTYAGSAVSWAPPSEGGVWVDYAAPPNPNGGDQFFGTSGQGREWRNAAQNGPIVNCDVDFLNGPEHDFDLYQAALTSRGNWSGTGPGNMAGFYSAVASNYEAPPEPPRGGDWAPTWQVYDKFGTKLVNVGIGWRYDNEPGFDLLPRETWRRMGYSYDTVSRRYTEFRSGDKVMTNPQALYDYDGPEGPLPPELVDLYILGGSPTDGIAPDNAAIADSIGIYNVGNGQVHLWDNLAVQSIPEPSTVMLLVTGLVGLVVYWRRRK